MVVERLHDPQINMIGISAYSFPPSANDSL